MSEHVFDTSGIGRGSDEITVPVEDERAIAYAKATNESRPQHLDGTLGAPVYAVVPALPDPAQMTMSAVPDELMLRILHGELRRNNG